MRKLMHKMHRIARLLSAFEVGLRTGSTAADARDLDPHPKHSKPSASKSGAAIGTTIVRAPPAKLIPTEAAIAYGKDITRARDLMEFTTSPGGALEARLGAVSVLIARKKSPLEMRMRPWFPYKTSDLGSFPHALRPQQA